ncbi:MAG: YfhO family protein [Erysipelotrichaceae bacterium]|nr:YfhO family protein [Erysipelotrichaceae bacterium]
MIYLRNKKYYLATILIVCMFFSWFLLFNDGIFLFEGDMLTEGYNYYVKLHQQLKTGGFTFWNANNVLGANQYGNLTYFGLTSPYTYLILLVPHKLWILPMILISNLVKSLVLASGVYLWMYKLYKSHQASFIAAIMLTFSGFVVTNYNNDVMLAPLSFMPFVLYYTEELIQRKKINFKLSIFFGLVVCANYYFAYLFLPFLAIYALARACTRYGFKYKLLFELAYKWILAVVVGLLLSMFVLYPSYLALQGNPRVTSWKDVPLWINKYQIYRFITGFFNPINDWRLNNNYFISTAVDAGIGYSGGMAVYSFVLLPIAVVLLLQMKRSKEQIAILIMYGLYMLFVCMPVFYVLFNLSLESRWMFHLYFIHALTIGYIFTHQNEIHTRNILLTFVLVVLAVIIFLGISHHYHFIVEPWAFKIVLRNSLIFILIAALYMVYFKKPMEWLIIGILVLEVIFTGYNVFYNDGNKLDPMSKEEVLALNLDNSKVFDTIKAQDQDFYRIDMHSLDPLSENESNAYDYHSFVGYTSTYNFNQQDFNTNRFKLSYMMYFYPQSGKGLLKDLLSNKYFIQRHQHEYPLSHYEEILKEDTLTVYKNKNFLPFAYCKPGIINKEQFDKLPILIQDYLLVNTNVIEDGKNNYEMITELTLLEDSITTGSELDLSGFNKGYLYVTFDGSINVGYSMKDAQGKELSFGYFTKEFSYVGIPIVENAASIYFTVEGYAKVYYDDFMWYEPWYQKTKECSIKSEAVSSDYLRGSIEVPSDQLLATTIAYDDGWSVYVDYKKVKSYKVNNGFVGFYLPKGKHIIELKYRSSGFKESILISTLTLSFIVFYSWRKRKCRS